MITFPRTPPVGARELMEAILNAAKLYRGAVLAVDAVGLLHRQVARRLRTREETITWRLHRVRRYGRPLIRRAVVTGVES